MSDTPSPPEVPSDAELRERLTPEEYHITQQCGTEPAFTGKYWNEKADGTYACKVCGTTLFDSTTKFDSGSGWPSFTDVAAAGTVRTLDDYSAGVFRTEVRCASCDAHLGHVFPDGPRGPGQTGLRYCINSAAIDLNRR